MDLLILFRHVCTALATGHWASKCLSIWTGQSIVIRWWITYFTFPFISLSRSVTLRRFQYSMATHRPWFIIEFIYTPHGRSAAHFSFSFVLSSYSPSRATTTADWLWVNVCFVLLFAYPHIYDSFIQCVNHYTCEIITIINAYCRVITITIWICFLRFRFRFRCCVQRLPK